MSIHRLIIVFAFIILPISICQGDNIGRTYHIKFDWKVEQNPSKYYEMTTYIFDSMRKEGVFLYSEYGNLNAVHIYLSKSESYAKLIKTISDANHHYINPVIDYNSAVETPLHRLFLDKDDGQKDFSCKAVMPKKFNSVDEAMTYLTKIQYYILRRGHLISMTFMGRPEKKYDISFNFLADCGSKEAIVNDLLDIISHDKKGPRSLY